MEIVQSLPDKSYTYIDQVISFSSPRALTGKDPESSITHNASQNRTFQKKQGILKRIQAQIVCTKCNTLTSFIPSPAVMQQNERPRIDRKMLPEAPRPGSRRPALPGCFRMLLSFRGYRTATQCSSQGRAKDGLKAMWKMVHILVSVLAPRSSAFSVASTTHPRRRAHRCHPSHPISWPRPPP